MSDAPRKATVSGSGGPRRQPQAEQVTTYVPYVPPAAPAAPAPQPPTEEPNNIFSVAFAKIAYVLSEGEIEGFPGEIFKNIYFESTPIQNPDGSFNYGGYSIDYRSGTDETQTPIPGFNVVENARNVGVAVTQASGAITRTISDTDTERCRVIIGHPVLQASTITNGSITNASVRYQISVSANGGPFVIVADPTVTGRSSSGFQRAYEFDLPGIGPWSIRVTRISADSSSVYLQNQIIWQSYTEIIDEKFAYPNTAILGVRVDARQFTAIPDVSVRLRGKRIQIPSNYNPVTRSYSGFWDGTFTVAWTDNPAWIFRDIVLNKRFGVARYVPTVMIDPWYLYTISQYCDQLVNNGSGGYEPRFRCNVYLQNPGSVYQVLNALASCFRGLIHYTEGRMHLTQDRPSPPVQQFSEANTIQEVDDAGNVTSPCFDYTGVAKSARKTVVLANWDDPSQDFLNVTEYLQDDVLLERFGYNPIDLRLLGVTSRGQALRAAKHTLFTSRYETEKVRFRVAAEGLAAGVGEIIKITDPLKQGQRLGGRIYAINGNSVTLDAALSLTPGISYTLTLVLPNGETTVNADGSRTTTPRLQVVGVVSYTTITGASDFRDLITQSGTTIVTQSLDQIFGYVDKDDDYDEGRTTVICNTLIDSQVGALWVLEWNDLTAAEYRIVSVAEVDPLIYQVEAIAHNSSKYDYLDNNLPVSIPRDRFKLQPTQAPDGVSAKLDFRNNRTQIIATWAMPQVGGANDLGTRSFLYQYRLAGSSDWSDPQSTATPGISISLPDYVYGQVYDLRVASSDRLGRQSAWVEVVVADLDALPDLSDPTYSAIVRHANQPDGTQLLIVSAGSCPVPERVNGYKIWAFPTNVPTTIPGVKEPDSEGWYFLTDIPLTGYYTIAFHAPGDWTIRVAFTSAVFGENPADYIYDVVYRAEIVPPTPSRFTVVEGSAANNKRFSWNLPLSTYGSWDQSVVSDIAGYEVRYKQGPLVNSSPSQTWDLGVDLPSGGVPATQQWFETGLFDKGTWTVMIKAVDTTQWRSDNPAFIILNVTATPVSNAVYSESIDSLAWPGTYANAEVFVTDFDIVTQDGQQLITQDEDDQLSASTGFYSLRQVNPLIDSYYIWTFDNNFLESSLLIETAAAATYQHRIEALSGVEINLLQEDDNEIRQEDDSVLNTEQLFYTKEQVSGQAGGILHPYAPYERLTEDVYAVKTLFRSTDGVTKGELYNLDLQLDYPDIAEQIEDVAISPSELGTEVMLSKPFRAVKSVQLTLQDVGTGAVTAVVLSKSVSAVTVKCINSAGSPVSGLVDITIAGY
jgi:predicted phage tail protein